MRYCNGSDFGFFQLLAERAYPDNDSFVQLCGRLVSGYLLSTRMGYPAIPGHYSQVETLLIYAIHLNLLILDFFVVASAVAAVFLLWWKQESSALQV
jgi:hypothetical protein